MKMYYVRCNIVLISLGLDIPPAAEGFVEVDEREILVADGVAHADLGLEVAALGIEDVDVVEGATAILESGEMNIFGGSIAQIGFESGRLVDALIVFDCVVDFVKRSQNRLFIAVACLLIGGD